MRDRRGEVSLRGVSFLVKGLAAQQELQLERWTKENESTLAGWGLVGEDARALAENGALLYAGVACTGLWRSRTSFAGNPLWPNLAGLAALLGAAGAAVYAAMIAGSWFMLTTV